MHQQIRTLPRTSAADVEKLLGRLAERGVNLAAAGGGDLEFGGEFAFAVDHEWQATAIEVLDKFKYTYRVIGATDPRLTVCWLENQSGALYRCIKGVAEENLKSGRIIRDLIVGAPGGDDAPSPNHVPVQIFSEEVRTPQTVDSGPTAS